MMKAPTPIDLSPEAVALLKTKILGRHNASDSPSSEIREGILCKSLQEYKLQVVKDVF